MYHLKEVHGQVSGNLDLNRSEDEEFSPDKLRASLERLYMTVVSDTVQQTYYMRHRHHMPHTIITATTAYTHTHIHTYILTLPTMYCSRS